MLDSVGIPEMTGVLDRMRVLDAIAELEGDLVGAGGVGSSSVRILFMLSA